MNQKILMWSLSVITLVVVAFGGAVGESAWAQKSDDSPSTEAAEAAEQESSEEVEADPLDIFKSEAHRFSYDASGRRDPFQSLLNKPDSDDSGNVIEGIEGTSVGELKLNGILQDSNGGFYALMVANDGKAYPVREGDKVLDGRVLSVTKNKIIFEKYEYDIVTGEPKPPKRVPMKLHVED